MRPLDRVPYGAGVAEVLGGSVPAASEGVALAVMGCDNDSFAVALPWAVEESADPLRDV